MRGQIVQYEALTVYEAGIEKGFKDATQKYREKNEEHAQRMLRDHLPLSTIEKYTDLPMSRIQELASSLELSTKSC